MLRVTTQLTSLVFLIIHPADSSPPIEKEFYPYAEYLYDTTLDCVQSKQDHNKTIRIVTDFTFGLIGVLEIKK